MRRHWTQHLPNGRAIECRLPWWYPAALRLLGFLSALRGRYPDDAALLRLRQSCLRLRPLPHGRWMRWHDLDDDLRAK
jgi:hypothetical protein